MINWRAFPFVRILLAFLVGIITALRLDMAIPFGNLILFFLSLFIVLLAYSQIAYRFRSLFGGIVLMFFSLLAYQMCIYHNDLRQKNHFQTQLTTNNIFIGKIINEPSFGDWTKCYVSLIKIKNDSTDWHTVKGKLFLYIKASDDNQQLAYGDLISFKGTANPITAPKNPKAFDFKKYLFPQNIHHQIFLEAEQLKQLQSNTGNPVLSLAYRWRKKLLGTLQINLKTQNEYAIAAALILGYREELSLATKNAFAQTGAMHVLAVSGLHVGLIFLILSFFLNKINFKTRYWKLIKTLLLLFGLWSFALITGASPSVLRAATMFSFIIVGKAIQRDTSIYNILAVSAFCLLMYDPFLILNIGFQLSYLALIGIVYFQPKIYKKWYIKNRFGDYIWKLIAVSLAAQITTLPISLFYFHQFPIYFWLSGIVVVPAATVILSIGLLLIFTSFIIPLFNPAIAFILWWSITIMNALVFLIQKIPFSLMTGIWISIITVIVLYIFIGCLIIAINTKRSKWLIASILILAIAITNYSIKSVRQYHQKEIVIYSVFKNSLIDFIDGKQVVSLKNETLTEDKINFANQNYQNFKGITNTDIYLLEDKQQLYQTTHFMHTNSFIQFHDLRLGIIDNSVPISKPDKLQLDFLIIRNNPHLKIAELTENFEFQQLIVDGSNTKQNINNWKLECQNLSIPFVDVANEGAFIIN